MIRPDAAPVAARARRTVRRARGLALLTLLSIVTISGVETQSASASLPTWSMTNSANATNSTTNEIEGVSCPTETTCVAVGSFLNAAGIRRTLGETGQARRWSIAPTANPGTASGSLSGIACTSATSCVAVGSASNGTQLVTLIETWDGSSWSIASSPNIGTAGNELLGVSCASATSCVAVGYFTDAVGVVRTLVETWDGASWSVTASPSPGPSNAVLNGVSCASATTCVAVGYSVAFDGSNRTLVETSQGTVWTVTPVPSPGPSAMLSGVSCPTSTSCVAVGWSGDPTRRTLIESWRGTSWSVATNPSPSAARTAYLRGVSCTTTARCIAVGLWTNGSTTRSLIQGWDGTAWSSLSSPNPGTLDSTLNGVSCASATSCAAAGYRLNNIVARTLVVSGTAAPDVTPPLTLLSTPVDGSYYVLGQNVAAAYVCVDEIGGSGTSSCVGTVARGAPIDTSSAGVQSFSATGTDGSGNSSTSQASYTVVPPVSASLTLPVGGGSVTTDAGPGPTALAPIATTVTSVDAGTVGIDQGAVTLVRPSGFDLLGMEMNIVAPTASNGAPLTVSFDVDAAMLSPGTTKDNLAVLLNGALLSECPAATSVPAAVDACVSNRADAPSGGGDARVTVVSVSGGQWNLAAGAVVPPRLVIGSTSAVEGDAGTTTMQLPVLLSAPSVVPVSVHYASADGAATAGSDYVATSGTLTFPAGQAAASVPVEIIGDTKVEPPESFTVVLSSPAGATLGSAVGSGTILDDDATVPTAALSVRAGPGNASVALQWSAPTANGGRPIGGYVVTPFVGNTAGTPRVFTTVATSQMISGLTNGTAYTFAVAAANAVGTGAASVRSAPVTVGAPGAPTVSANASSARAVLTWTAPVDSGYGVTSYLVTASLGGVLQAAQTHTVTCTQPCVPARTWTMTGLANGSVYTFEVEAHNSQGSGALGATTILVSATPTLSGKPGTPTARAAAGSVTVSWTAPTAGTATITAYVIVVYKNGVMGTTAQLAPLTTHIFQTVVAGAAYSYKVEAVNAVGTGPLSGLSAPVTPT